MNTSDQLAQMLLQWWTRPTCQALASRWTSWQQEGPSAILSWLLAQPAGTMEQTLSEPRWFVVSDSPPAQDPLQDVFAYESACQCQLKLSTHWATLSHAQLCAELAIQIDLDAIVQELQDLVEAPGQEPEAPLHGQVLDFVAQAVHQVVRGETAPLYLETNNLVLFFLNEGSLLRIAVIADPVETF